MTEPEINPTESSQADTPSATSPDGVDASSRLSLLRTRYWSHKRWTIPLTILVVVGILAVIPATRYPIAGIFLKPEYVVRVIDASTNQPVSNVSLHIANDSATTDAKGEARLRSKVGMVMLKVNKKYYKSVNQSVFVPIKQNQALTTVTIQATGRQIPVSVTNKITGKPVTGARIAAAGSEAKSDSSGKVTLVVPAEKKTVTAIVKAKGYVDVSIELKVTEQAITANEVRLVSSGKIYFLSKLSGKIDVVKTNLDGSNRQTVLAGTGNESTGDTIMLATTDWKYLVLESARDGGEYPKLFLINTATDKLTTLDEGKATFEAVGWSEHHFVYKVGRTGKENWQPGGQALKSYDAAADKLITIDETDGEGIADYDFASNNFGQIFVLNNEVVYHKNWIASYSNFGRLSGKQVKLTSVKPDGIGKRVIRDFPIPENSSYYAIDSRLYAPQELYVQVPSDKPTYFEYEDGKLTAKSDVTDQQFNRQYPTYLISPNAQRTVWTEERDGKNIVFVGTSQGKDAKEIASLSEYTPYGWYTDDYLLVSKKNSELFIMPAAGGQLLKVSDYHKPEYNFRAYGGGYGGL